MSPRLSLLAGCLVGLLLAPQALAWNVTTAGNSTAEKAAIADFTSKVSAITAADGASPYIAAAKLNGTNQVPTAVNTTATAWFFLAVGKTNATWVLQSLGVKNFLMSHIHYGNSTTNGPVGVLLAPGGNSSLITSGQLPTLSPTFTGDIRASATFTAANIAPNPTGGANITFTDFKSLIDSSSLYVNIHSTEYPPGVIRGQLQPSTL